MARAVRSCLLAALASLVLAGRASADDEPLWEAGVGVGVFRFPAYRGSSTIEGYVLPVPYFIYHGDFFKSDRRGVRGDFVDSGAFELSISASASPPTRSDDVPIREGMPDLKPTAELGPELDVTLYHDADFKRALYLRLPVREAFTLQTSPRGVGVVASPHLALDLNGFERFPGWNLGILAGPIFGTRAQNSYFYSVAPAYATPTRPAYAAGGGYAGTQFITALSKRYQDFWVGAFVRYDTLAHAAFADSPLVTRHSFLAGGVGVSWIFARSEERVPVDGH
jgi:outer membrane scaffolding protein for murein synthesis (MipA/OmpV family)